VTLIASQTDKSAVPSDLQTRMDQLVQEIGKVEEDKRKLSKEKDELQQQLIQQKDRMLEAERESGRVKSSLAALEGEAGGHAKGESVQLQKSVRDLTTNIKLKDAEIQKLKEVISLFAYSYLSLL
jgi:chromosome segregation ATPase